MAARIASRPSGAAQMMVFSDTLKPAAWEVSQVRTPRAFHDSRLSRTH
ncbi:hypothetical protein ACFQX6_18190 [Streptosporangium lutulentum]